MRKAWLAFLVFGVVTMGVQQIGALAAQMPASATKTIELPPDNPMATLKPGPGVEVARSNCVSCHSTDYIVRQPGGDAKHWEPEVRKMVAVYGAAISDADVQTIVNYLGTEYATPPVANQPATDKSPEPRANRQGGETARQSNNP